MAPFIRQRGQCNPEPFAPTVLELCKAGCWLCTSLWAAQQITHMALLHANVQWSAQLSWMAPLQALLRLLTL